MRPMRSFIPLVLAGIAAACGSVPSETDPPPIGREVAPTGVLRGTLVYSGPHPCSSNGHIVGAAIIYVFDRRNPPPPDGLATTPVNFGVVTGRRALRGRAAKPRAEHVLPAPERHHRHDHHQRALRHIARGRRRVRRPVVLRLHGRLPAELLVPQSPRARRHRRGRRRHRRRAQAGQRGQPELPADLPAGRRGNSRGPARRRGRRGHPQLHHSAPGLRRRQPDRHRRGR